MVGVGPQVLIDRDPVFVSKGPIPLACTLEMCSVPLLQVSSDHDHEGRPVPRSRWPRLWAACGVVLAVLARDPPATDAATLHGPQPEYKIKAAFLIQFLNFVRWPEPTPTTPPALAKASRIGILGDDPFDEVFDGVQGTEVAGRPLEIVRFRRLKDVEPCHILFIATSEQDRFPEILRTLSGSNTLTVGDSPEFLRRGGMIQFYPMGNRIRFYIERGAMEREGLRPSAKLLEAAPGSSSSEDAAEREGRP